MFSKNQYFTIDGDYDFKVIRAFKVNAKPVEANFYFADAMVNELVEKRAEFCKLGQELAEANEIWIARMMFIKANQISNKIDQILEWNQVSQEMVLDWANRIMTERSFIN